MALRRDVRLRALLCPGPGGPFGIAIIGSSKIDSRRDGSDPIGIPLEMQVGRSYIDDRRRSSGYIRLTSPQNCPQVGEWTCRSGSQWRTLVLGMDRKRQMPVIHQSLWASSYNL